MQRNIATFSRFLADEEFELGRRWARDRLTAQSPDILAKILICEDDLSELTEEVVESLSPDSRIAAFADLYFDARVQIEGSYGYINAIEKIQQAKMLLRCEEEQLCPNLLKILIHVCDFQECLCDIDRGLYMDDPDRLIAPCDALITATEKSEAIAASLYGPWLEIYEADLKSIILSNALFAKSLKRLGAAHTEKWMQTKLDKKLRDDIQNNILTMESYGAHIQASEILPSLRSLETFFEIKGAHSELNVEAASTIINWFAIIDPALMSGFHAAVENEIYGRSGAAIHLKTIKCSAADKETLPDIWNDVMAGMSPYEYRWSLSDVTCHVGQEDVILQADLIYSRLGVWRLQLSTSHKNVSGSAFKHVGSLATPYALDSDISAIARNGTTQKYAFLLEFAEAVFTELERALKKHTPETDISLYGDTTLKWSLSRNWFVFENIDKLSLDGKADAAALNPDSFMTHPGFCELAAPAREVRVALASWVFRQDMDTDDNLAGIRYNKSEFISVSRNQSFSALLSHPIWVKAQAQESIIFCAAISHMLDLTSDKFLQLHSLAQNTSEDVSSKQLRADYVALQNVESYIINLLSTIEGGYIMSYADHSEFVSRALDKFDLHKTQSHLRDVLERSKQQKSLKMAEIDRRYKTWIKRAITLGTAFLSISALAQVIEVLESMNPAHYSLSPIQKLSAITICVLVIITFGFFTANRSD